MKISIFKRINKSIKVRIYMVLILGSLLPIIIIGIISIYFSFAQYKSNLNRVLENELNLSQKEMLHIMEDMKYMSEQLNLNKDISENLYKYFDENDPTEKVYLLKYLNDLVSLYEISNTNISNITYFYIDSGGLPYNINNSLARPSIPFDEKIFSKQNTLSYYGPHNTYSISSNYNVISLIRKIKVEGYPDVYLYMESGFKKLSIPSSKLLNELGAIYYVQAENKDVTYLSINENPKKSLKDNQSIINNLNITYETYTLINENNWTFNAMIPRNTYFDYLSKLAFNEILFIILALVICLSVSYVFWNTIKNPLFYFGKNLRLFLSNEVTEFRNAKIRTINVQEFDENFEYLETLNLEITNLIEKVKNEEKEKSKLEIKTLLYRINPHFISNTLNSLVWYAYEKNATDIADFVISLNKLLVYNLEKTKHTSLKNEIDAIHEYINLQKYKYELTFELGLEIPEPILNASVPRFILQPVVENAILHSFDYDKKVTINISLLSSGKISIKISNHGLPFSDELIKELNEEIWLSTKTGIGIIYVKRMIQEQFGSEAELVLCNLEENINQVELIFPFTI